MFERLIGNEKKDYKELHVWQIITILLVAVSIFLSCYYLKNNTNFGKYTIINLSLIIAFCILHIPFIVVTRGFRDDEPFERAHCLSIFGVLILVIICQIVTMATKHQLIYECIIGIGISVFFIVIGKNSLYGFLDNSVEKREGTYSFYQVATILILALIIFWVVLF